MVPNMVHCTEPTPDYSREGKTRTGKKEAKEEEDKSILTSVDVMNSWFLKFEFLQIVNI